MLVTDVKVFPVHEDRLKAYATITFDDCFVVRDLKIILGNSGLFVAMPSKRRKDGTFKDTAHPLNNETREMIETKVLAQFDAELQKMGLDPQGMQGRRVFRDGDEDEYGEESRVAVNAPAPVAAPAGAPVQAARAFDDGDSLPSTYRSKV